jgi:ribonuclease P protein component
MNNYAEANLSAKQSSSREDARIQSADGDQERPPGAEEASGQRTQTLDTNALLIRHRRSGDACLRNPANFRQVYEHGERLNGALITVFVLRSDLAVHRLGITASRKMSRKAVKRNRAKRLLRETFRLCGADLDKLQNRYDWVINARRALLNVKLQQPLTEFREVIARVDRIERGGT